VKRWKACCLAVELVVWPGRSIALAEKIPSPEALAQLGARPVTLSVTEPHLSTPEHPMAVDYLAFPAPVVISAALGPEWEAKTKMIEFRALDGYGWGVGLTILTALGNLLPALSEEEAYLALFHGARRVAADCDGQALRRERAPLGSRPEPAVLKRWLRRWTKVRHREAAERTLVTGIDAGLSPAALADACSRRRPSGRSPIAATRWTSSTKRSNAST
jgi:hypothetical protein